MNNLDKQYQSLLTDIIENGVKKGDRTGTGTISLFGRQIRHKMSDGFPLLTTKKMAWKQIVTELIWFLRGDTNIRYLVDNNCHIWDGDAYKSYLNRVKISSNPFDRNIISSQPSEEMPGMSEFKIGEDFTREQFVDKIKTDERFAEQWGDLGPIYGKQWRYWSHMSAKEKVSQAIGSGGPANDYVDQIEVLINTLKTNPDDRRMIVSAWNVADLDSMVLPPCHYGFQVWTREMDVKERNEWFDKNWGYGGEKGGKNNWKDFELDQQNVPKRAISLMWNQRSVDTFLGLPFNIASYGLLLEILAKKVNMVPDELIGNLGDTHLYSNHIDQAKEQIIREAYKLPKLKHFKTDDFWKIDDFDSIVCHLNKDDFGVDNYQSHEAIKAQLSN